MKLARVYRIEVVVFNKENQFKVAIDMMLITSYDVQSEEFLEQLYLEDELLRIHNFTMNCMDITPIGEKLNAFKLVLNQN